MKDNGLRNKVVLITGCNNPHGIGAATAEAFAEEGAALYMQYLRPPVSGPAGEAAPEIPGEAFYRLQQTENADAALRRVREAGGRAEAEEADLADASVIPGLFDRAEKSFGPVDILINNAAHCDADTFMPRSTLAPEDRAADGFPMGTISAEKHDRHFAVNSRAAALLMAEFARRHVKRNARWGRIINISTDGASGFLSQVSYGASKHALESYSRAAAAELGRWGITVNIVSLGPIQTGWITPEMEERISSRIPLHRIGHPDDIADIIVFLASEQSRWLTGQLLYAGGGWQMGL